MSGTYLRLFIHTVPSPIVVISPVLTWLATPHPSGFIVSVNFLRSSWQPFIFPSTQFYHYFLLYLIHSTFHNLQLYIWLFTFNHSTNIYGLPTMCYMIYSGEHSTCGVWQPLLLISFMRGKVKPVFANHCIPEHKNVPGI